MLHLIAIQDMCGFLQNTRYGGRKLDSQVMIRRVNWLNSIREWQQDFLGSLDAREFVDCVTDELFGKGVFVFTPFGDVMRLPKVYFAVDWAVPQPFFWVFFGGVVTGEMSIPFQHRNLL